MDPEIYQILMGAALAAVVLPIALRPTSAESIIDLRPMKITIGLANFGFALAMFFVSAYYLYEDGIVSGLAAALAVASMFAGFLRATAGTALD